MDELLELVCAPMVLLPVLLDVRAILSGLFALQVIRVLLVPLLFEIVLGDLAVPVHAVAAWGPVEDLAATLGASVMASARLVVEADAGRRLLGEGCGAGSLHVASVAEHGHLHANLRDAVLVLVVVYRTGTGPLGRGRASAFGRLVFGRELAKASRLGLGRVGACDRLDPALRRRRRDRSPGCMQRKVASYGLRLLRGAIGLLSSLALVGERLGKVLEAGVFVALLPNAREGGAGRARRHIPRLGRWAITVGAVEGRGRVRVSVRVGRS